MQHQWFTFGQTADATPHSVKRPLKKGGGKRLRIPSRLRYEIEMLEKRAYVNSPLSWDMILATFLGTGTSIITLDSGDYNINFNLGGHLTAASLVINAGANVTFTSSETLASLTLNGGTAGFTAATNYTLTVDNLAIKSSGPSNGLLDLANSDLYLPSTAANFTALQQFWVNGYNLNSPDSQAPGLLGDWSGFNGITSSAARDAYSSTGNLKTSLGIYDGSFGDANGVAMGRGADEVNNLSPNLAANRILVRATPTGDLNGNGVVNQYDILIFNTFGNYLGGPNTNPLGTQAGDLNGDRQVDDADILIFNTAGNYEAPAAVAPGVTAVPIAATAGVSFTGQVATFGSSTPGSTAADYSASINWGDGSSTDSTSGRDRAHAVTITGDSITGFSVSGIRTYAANAHPANAMIAVMHNPSQLRGTASVPVQLSEPSGVTVNPGSFTASRGQPTAGSAVATFTEVDTTMLSSDFTASVDWGDGSQSAGNVTGASGSFSVTANHTYDTAGDYTVSVAVYDVAGNSDSTSFPTTVAETAPDAPTGLTATKVGNDEADLSWNATDFATGYDIYRASSGGTPVFIDTVGEGVTFYQDTNAGKGLEGHTTFSYTVRATNDGGTSPDSNTANATTEDNAPIAVNVGNDFAGPINAVHGQKTTINLFGSDPDGDPIKYASASASNGTATISDDGSQIFYTSNMDYAGPDQITYTLTDDTKTSNTATIQLQVTNELPTVSSDVIQIHATATATIGDDITYSYAADPVIGKISANDVDTNALNYKMVSGPTGGGTF